MWVLLKTNSPGQYSRDVGSITHMFVVMSSEDMGNGRTKQTFVYFEPKTMKFAGRGDDIEYQDLPWENRAERKLIG